MAIGDTSLMVVMPQQALTKAVAGYSITKHMNKPSYRNSLYSTSKLLPVPEHIAASQTRKFSVYAGPNKACSTEDAHKALCLPPSPSGRSSVSHLSAGTASCSRAANAHRRMWECFLLSPTLSNSSLQPPFSISIISDESCKGWIINYFLRKQGKPWIL